MDYFELLISLGVTVVCNCFIAQGRQILFKRESIIVYLGNKRMNNQLQEEFYQVMTRLRGSRAASTQDDARVTEIINGLLVSKPAKKVEQIGNETKQTSERDPEIIDLQEYARSGKAASVPGINKLRVIHNFISSNGRV